MKKAQINELYITRALAILGVLIVHATSFTIGELNNESSLYGFYNFSNTFFRIGTTTFIFLSSFVLFYSYYHRPISATLIGNFYKKRFLYIIIPYILFTIVYFLYSYPVYSSYLSNIGLVKEFLLQLVQGKAAAHLYFVFISIQFYILFPILLLVFKRFPTLVKHTLWIGFAVQWLFVISNNMIFHLDKGNIALSYFSFYFLGIFFGVYFDRIKDFLSIKRVQLHASKIGLYTILLWLSWIVVSSIHVAVMYFSRTAVGFSIHPLMYELIWNIHTVLSALVLLQVSFAIYRTCSAKIVNTLIHLGVVSFGVYLIHLLVLNVAHKYIPYFGNSILYHSYILIGFLLSLFVSWLLVHITFKYFKYSWVIFGAAPKKMPQKSSPEIHTEKPDAEIVLAEDSTTESSKELIYK